ncbi:MAG: hypothetical protein PUC47_12855 [Oscillospiraceae bacterium]|nr:hypothetical protein [Oscillospiraceae bacterium]
MELCLDDASCLGLLLESEQLEDTGFVNPLFQWELRSLYLNGIPAVYAVNSTVRYRVFLYRIRRGDLRRLKEQTIWAIQAQMLADGFPPQWVEQYIRLAGEPRAVHLSCHPQLEDTLHLMTLLGRKGVWEALRSGMLYSLLNHDSAVMTMTEQEAASVSWFPASEEERQDVCQSFYLAVQELLESEGLPEEQARDARSGG